MRRDPLIYLQDILDSIDHIAKDTAGLTEEQFSQTRLVQQAVVRNLEIIGEAVQRIPDDVQSLYPTIPWRKIVAMRNKLIYEYFGLKVAVIWKTVQHDLPELKKELEQVLKDFSTEEK